MTRRPYPVCVETDTAVWVFAVPGELGIKEADGYVRAELRRILCPEGNASRREELERMVATARVTGVPNAVRVVKTGQFIPADLGWF
jgi:hypothetical protein